MRRPTPLLTILLLFTVVLISLSVSNSTVQEVDNSLANVQTVDGIYIFIRSIPVNKYIVMGTIDCPAMVNSWKEGARVKAMIKYANKKYNGFHGIVFRTGQDLCEADVIKFNSK